MSAIDVVIPTWNGWELLERCLARLRDQTVAHTVIVVDNGSENATAQRLRTAHPEVRLLVLERNVGFGAAVNRGVEAGEAPSVVLINNDVECRPRFLERVVAPLSQRADVGSVAGLLLTADGARIDSFGLELDVTLAAFPRFAGAPHPGTALDDCRLAGPSGGAAAYRRAALDAVGGFDEAIFAYMEDVDVAIRLRGAGWSAAAAPDAVGLHLGSATFGRRSSWQVETAGYARAYLLRKYGVLRRDPLTSLRAAVVEAGVTVADAALERRLAAARGRLHGWRRGRSASAAFVAEAVNPDIGLRESMHRRRASIRTS